eukprot:871395-Prymnesium_polylepis.1
MTSALSGRVSAHRRPLWARQSARLCGSTARPKAQGTGGDAECVHCCAQRVSAGSPGSGTGTLDSREWDT